MATCKDCVHFKICVEFLNSQQCITDDCSKCKGKSTCGGINNCYDFKDKSKIIELPCKVGDKLYDIALGKTAELTVIGINMCWNQNYKHITVHTHNYRSATLSWELKDFGKTIFLTNEEAEKALKELDFNE